MLLDSHVLLWLLDDDPRLGPAARQQISSAATVHFSAASVWELTIKHSLGRLTLGEGFLTALHAAGLRELPVNARHAFAVRDSQLPHKDPFDRLLVTQARTDNLTLVTADHKLLEAAACDVIAATA